MQPTNPSDSKSDLCLGHWFRATDRLVRSLPGWASSPQSPPSSPDTSKPTSVISYFFNTHKLDERRTPWQGDPTVDSPTPVEKRSVHKLRIFNWWYPCRSWLGISLYSHSAGLDETYVAVICAKDTILSQSWLDSKEDIIDLLVQRSSSPFVRLRLLSSNLLVSISAVLRNGFRLY